jgi:glyoxylase-like metal-dependent hydrolase (beta-lactamase superfamily II)
MKHTYTRIKALALAALSLAVLSGAQAQSAENQPPPGIVEQGPGVYSFNVGYVRVTALSDGTVPQDLYKLLRDTTSERTDALLRAGFLINPVEASINEWLFKLGGHTVLVDTGSGDLFGPGYGGKLPRSLLAAGLRPEQITDILLTHAHDDHMGGLVRGGRLAFPNATVHVGKPDIAFFLDRSNAARFHYDMHYFDEAIATLKPCVDAGKVQTFSGTTEIMPGVTASLHPGHTPGSAFYTLESNGQKIVFVGDIVHVASVQFPDPRITIEYDVNTAQAATARQQAFSDFARDRTLIAIPHVPFPGVGHVRAIGTGFEWVPIDYGNRLTK